MAVVGIDLGTTNTVVGAVRGGQASTLAGPNGQTLIPSVVSFHPNGSTVVGHGARERRAVDPDSTVYSIKRLIGRSWNSDEVARARRRFPFEMREGPGQAALIVARGETFTLPEISAFVLRHAKALAEKALGEDVDRVVITVPANFNDLQRAATKVAGRVAGLDVMRILNEPTAAALAYGYGKGNSERIAIYDFGGGTFDVTILDLSGNVFEVLATAGDTFLGGDDIDLAIAQHLAETSQAERGFDPRSVPQAFERVRIAAETAKRALATQQETRVTVPELTPDGLALDVCLTRADLSRVAGPIVERTFEVCRDALDVARLEPSALDQVVLVGGSTRLAVVRERVAAFFGRQPLDRINPDEVVAIGAAIQASALAGGERRRSTIPRPPMPAARGTRPGPGRPAALPGPSPPRLPLPKSVDRTTLEGPGPAQRPPLPKRRSAERTAPAPLPDSMFPLSEPPPEASPLAEARPRAGFGPPSPRGIPIPAAAPAAVPTEGDRPAALPTLDELFDAPKLTPVAPPVARVPVQEPRSAAPPLPLLVDVTPLSLCVETIGGYCDTVIERNTPVPCEQSRTFVTAADNQTAVRVRVGQGAAERFEDNTLLGEVELSELRPAPRGATQLVVTFSIDTDGILDVVAQDGATGRRARARLNLLGVPEGADIEAMASRYASGGA